MEIAGTSTRPLSRGVGTRRPSLVILTATWRRSLPSNRPKLASWRPSHRPAVRAVRAVYQPSQDRQPRPLAGLHDVGGGMVVVRLCP